MAYRSSVINASEEVFDFVCGPCNLDGEVLQAKGYCSNCQDYLCDFCFKIHLRPKPMRHHVLLDEKVMPTDKMATSVKKASDICTEICDKHSGNIVEYYCQSHDFMCCSKCLISENHRTCEGVVCIEDAASDIYESKELTNFEGTVDHLGIVLSESSSIQHQNDEDIKIYSIRAKNDIKSFRANMNGYLDRLENAMDNEVSKMKDRQTSQLCSTSEQIEHCEKDIKAVKETIERTRKLGQKSNLYIYLKRNSDQFNMLEDRIETVKAELDGAVSEYTFTPDGYLHRQQANTFGTLVITKSAKHIEESLVAAKNPLKNGTRQLPPPPVQQIATEQKPTSVGPPAPPVRNKQLPPPVPVKPPGRYMPTHSHGFDSRRSTGKVGLDTEKLEDMYDNVPRTSNHFDLRKDQIQLQGQLGTGQFGSVYKGICTFKDGKKIPVAVKTLKSEDCNPSQENELIKVAKIMMPFSHKHIVRMIGLCKSDCIMLVLELAPLGPLKTFLQLHKDTPQANIVELLWQVAMGMEYLETMRVVHRDLSARNVLLVSKNVAKISDFSMSKAYDKGSDCYEAEQAGKWQCKWYAPECLYYWTFNSKSDVWSYGVTMWEATSYGETPFKKMKGQEIMQFLVEEERRLDKPEHCDQAVYEVMLSCWEYDPNDRPSFYDIAQTMGTLHRTWK